MAKKRNVLKALETDLVSVRREKARWAGGAKAYAVNARELAVMLAAARSRGRPLVVQECLLDTIKGIAVHLRTARMIERNYESKAIAIVRQIEQDPTRPVPPYCGSCNDTCVDVDDPDRVADCRVCGGAFAWRQREAYLRGEIPRL